MEFIPIIVYSTWNTSGIKVTLYCMSPWYCGTSEPYPSQRMMPVTKMHLFSLVKSNVLAWMMHNFEQAPQQLQRYRHTRNIEIQACACIYSTYALHQMWYIECTQQHCTRSPMQHKCDSEQAWKKCVKCILNSWINILRWCTECEDGKRMQCGAHHHMIIRIDCRLVCR